MDKGGLSPFVARRVVGVINSNLSRKIRIQDLATGAKLSSSHFCRAFRTTFGVPPVVYVAHQRIRRAQELMRKTSDPLVCIALECGLCDQAHLTRVFRRVMGMSPSAWRRQS